MKCELCFYLGKTCRTDAGRCFNQFSAKEKLRANGDCARGLHICESSLPGLLRDRIMERMKPLRCEHVDQFFTDEEREALMEEMI